MPLQQPVTELFLVFADVIFYTESTEVVARSSLSFLRIFFLIEFTEFFFVFPLWNSVLKPPWAQCYKLEQSEAWQLTWKQSPRNFSLCYFLQRWLCLLSLSKCLRKTRMITLLPKKGKIKSTLYICPSQILKNHGLY